MTESAREAMEKSRSEVIECEEEIKSIKNALRALTGGGDSSAPSSNRLEVSVVRVVSSDGESATATATVPPPTTFKIQLSSPIEERTLTKLYDPLDPAAADGVAIFASLEASNALLTVEAYASDDGSLLLGSSAPHDLQPLCDDAELWRNGGEKKVSSLDVAIVAAADDAAASSSSSSSSSSSPSSYAAAPGSPTTEAVETKESSSESWEDAASEEENAGEIVAETEVEGGGDGATTGEEDVVLPEESGVGEKKADDDAAVLLLLPLCTLALRVAYFPSAEDRRDALYDRLNEVSKRKVAAIEALRRSAGVVNRARVEAEEAAGGSGGGKRGGGAGGQAVKSGFLNKSKPPPGDRSTPPPPPPPPPFWKRWYDRTLGPRSMLWVAGPIAFNYVLFGAASLFLHFKGDLLALPPPV